MIINIASFGGRAHLLDLARELDKLGHTVRFYSYVSNSRAKMFGLRKECNYSLQWCALPYLIWLKLFGFGGWGTVIYQTIIDWLMCIYMKRCDVFIGQSPMHYRSLKAAKKRWNAITILERGNSHRLEYMEHLKREGFDSTINKYFVTRDIRAYSVPDYISVGAEHVKDSFVKHGISANRLFVNNYGFDTSGFRPTRTNGCYDIIMVGTWCYRKGCDKIIELSKSGKYNILHVGPMGDLTIPENSGITHVDSVDESRLLNYYRLSKVLLLPSREEGLALVQLQAAACGLPIVCSRYSGGRDIKQYADHPEYIIEVDEKDIESIEFGVKKALQLASHQSGERNYMGKGLSMITFKEYAKKYSEFIEGVRRI